MEAFADAEVMVINMETFFLTILNMSITAGWTVCAVLLLRLIIKRMSRSTVILLWSLVGLRLILPYSVKSTFSLIPSSKTLEPAIMYTQTPSIESGIPYLNQTINPILSETFAPTPEFSVNPIRTAAFIASAVWMIGMVLMLLYAITVSFMIRRRIRESVHVFENIYISDRIDTPFIFGIFRPRIYIPALLWQTPDVEYIIAHERSHLKRLDHIWKPMGYLLLCVYWFHPLLWVAYILLCRDIEYACDERVIDGRECEWKKSYSSALLNCSIPRRMIHVCPLAFGETSVKGRIHAILHYKKTAFWILLVSIILSCVAAIAFMTDPIRDESSDKNGYYLQIGAEYVGCIEISLAETRFSVYPKNSKYFGVNDRIYLDQLENCDDLIGLSLTAYDKNGIVLYHASIPGPNGETKVQSYQDAAWRIMPEDASDIRTEYIPVTETLDIHLLKQQYPHFFGLDTSKGLSVFVWQMASTSYSCALLPESNIRTTEEVWSLTALPAASITEMRAIVDSYGLSKDRVSIIPIIQPISSCYYQIDDAYIENLTNHFWSITPFVSSVSIVLAEADFDIDCDGIIEHCTITPGPTSGRQTVYFTVTENGVVEYKNYLDCAYQTFSFVSDENGNTVLLCHDETNTPIPFDLTINNGLVLVTHPDPAVTFGMSYHEPEA